MPAYNNAAFIGDAVESVLAQSYTDWELLIIDDCSTDGTWDILQRYASTDERIHIFRTPQNAGSGYARNIGIEQAQGRYLAFLDGDDWWYPEKLATQLDFMQRNGY